MYVDSGLSTVQLTQGFENEPPLMLLVSRWLGKGFMSVGRLPVELGHTKTGYGFRQNDNRFSFR